MDNTAINTQNTLNTQNIEDLCGAVLRSFTSDPKWVLYNGLAWKNDNLATPLACHIQINAQDQDQPSLDEYRALVDSLAARKQFSQPETIQALKFNSPIAQTVFDTLEQIRCDSLMAQQYPGVKRNIQSQFERWSQQFESSGLLETSLGILLFALIHTCWTRITAYPLSVHAEDIMETTRGKISGLIGHELSLLRRTREQPAEFIQIAWRIAQRIGTVIQDAQSDNANTSRNRKLRNNFALVLNYLNQEQDELHATTGASKAWQQHQQQYRIFTNEFDKVTPAHKLARSELLQEWRHKLDRQQQQLGLSAKRIAQILKPLFMRPTNPHWVYEQEHGYVDGAQLTQLVLNPERLNIFKQIQPDWHSSSAITFLVDCSGSMKGQREYITLLIDIMAHACSILGVQTEVIGFTTGQWNGGRAKKKWQRTRAPNPGRLNEVQYYLLKTTKQDWNQARRTIAALLKADLYREGIDGEAVAWASERLLNQDVEQRILLCFSDGSPMDSATNQGNDEFYLDQHLKQMVRKYSNDIHILGIGLGLSLSPFYQHHIALDSSQPLQMMVFNQIYNALRKLLNS